MSVIQQVRQGDVFLRPTEVPEGGTPIPPDAERGVVLAYGEVSGHAHVVDGDVEFIDMNNRRYLNVKSDATLVHEEHGAIPLPVGGYEVIRQRQHREANGRAFAPVGD